MQLLPNPPVPQARTAARLAVLHTARVHPRQAPYRVHQPYPLHPVHIVPLNIYLSLLTVYVCLPSVRLEPSGIRWHRLADHSH
eukprot:4235844-Pyramimonas_sp.AAC.1